jgi:hypothetical protein
MSPIAGDLTGLPPFRLNLAVGLFDRMDRTWTALREFRQHNLDLTRCRFVISREPRIFSQQGLTQLSTEVCLECISLNEMGIDQVWSRIVTAKALETGAMPAHPDVVDCDTTATILARQNQRLLQHLELGGGVLVVGLADQTQQRLAAELMLSLAIGVFTHQLRAPRAGLAPGNGSHSAKLMGKSPIPARAI